MRRIFIKFVILWVIFLGSSSLSSGQGLVLGSYGGQSQISNSHSVKLTNGFYVPNGGNVRIFISPSFTDCIPLSASFSSDQNYVLARTFKVAGVTAANINAARNICEENRDIQYFDGLGRPMQQISVQGSPAGNDLVQPLAYDEFGREKFRYLPYSPVGGNGSYRSDALMAGAGVESFYNPSPGGTSGSYLASGIVRNPAPFAETAFEASPLNRVLATGAPGEAWQLANNHTQKIAYRVNNSSTSYTSTGYAVRLFNATPLAAPNEYQRSLGGTGYYGASELQLTVTNDENWIAADGKAGTTETYTDKMDRVVLKRSFNKVGATVQVLSTYYVYDDLGNLSFVLPPGTNPDAASLPNQTALDNFGYQYRYDGKRRLVEKKIPGKGWEYLVYNRINQVVFTQDANQRLNSQWTFTKYDAMGREILTGGYQDGSLRVEFQTNILAIANPLYETRDNSTATGYTNVAYPNVAITAYWTRSYYDDYEFLNMATTFPPIGIVSNKTKGLLTGRMVYRTDQVAGFWTMYYYDEEGRVKETYVQNHLSGYDRTVNTYNFAGELKNVNRTHVANTVTTTVVNNFHYDHRGRSTAATSNINGQGEVVLNRNYYNEIGQLNQKNLHSVDAGGSFLQTSILRYNERGWLKSSVSNQFSFQLNYNDGSVPQYNGNISNQLWGPGPSMPNSFTYSYDKLDRLTSGASTGISMSEVLTYDVMGNINTLARDGGAARLYVYTGNKLDHVEWITNSYLYDVNGNATTDGRSGATVAYNFLNLPTSVTKTGLNLAYIYTAEGVKLRKTNSTASTVEDYVGGIHYSNNVLKFIQTPEGRATNVGGVFIYEYDLRDHLGNVRLSFRKVPETGALAVLQRDDYYPFGMQKVATAGNNKYLYNGKELQTELGQYDYGARFYDPIIGRFNTIDRFAEKYDGLSPYQYGANNPVLNIDVNGDSLWVVHKGNQILYENGKVFNKDGSEYTGKGVKVNKDGTRKLKGFLKAAVNGLNDIRTGGDAGNELISNLQGSKENIFIKDGASNTTRGLMVSWNPSSTEGGLDVNGNRTTSSFIGLAHELAHAWDWAADGKIDARAWFKMSDGKAIPNAEKYGSHWENRIRAENKLPLREYYGIDNGAGAGRLLIPSTRSSSNYFMQLGPIIMPYYYRK